MARIPFVRHRTANQIRAKYRACRHPIEKVRWHAVWLLARTDEPRTPAQVAALVGRSDVTVRDVLHRWNAAGPDGLTDRRKDNGADPKLTARQRDALLAALQERPPDGGVWTGPKVIRYVADRWGIVVGPVTGWRWLVGLGFTLQVPRPSHPRAADAPTRRAWKKTCGGGCGSCGPPTPGRRSRWGPRTRRGWASSRSPGGCGRSRGATPGRAGGPSPSGSTSTGSPDRPPGRRSPSSSPG